MTSQGDQIFENINRQTHYVCHVLNNIKLNVKDNSEGLTDIINALSHLNNTLQQDRTHFSMTNFYSYLQTIRASIGYGQVAALHDDESTTYSEIRRMLIDQIVSIQGQIDLLPVLSRKIAEPINNSAPSVPIEKSAPIRVAVENNKIVISIHQSRIGAINYASANRIRESLCETFSDTLSELESNSNLDRRFIKSCYRLLDHLSSPIEETSIEALGLNYQLVGRLVSGRKEEIGSVYYEEFEHTLAGIGVLLNQFQEWQDFLQELSLTNIDPGDARMLVSQAAKLIDELEAPGAPVDEAISSRLKEMVEPVTLGLIDADSVAVPLAASLSNIFSLMAQVSIDSLGATGTAGVSMMFVSYAVGVLQKFCPTLSQYQPFKFIVEVVTYLQKNWSFAKDTI